MTAPPVLVGVDVLDVARITRAMAYSGDRYAAHVAGPAEADLHPDPALSVAAAVAVKECLVKAVGGRPPGFSWHDFAATDGPAPDWAGELLADAVPGVEAAADVVLTETCAYLVGGASGRAALTRFTGPAPDPGLTVVGAARWGWSGDLVVALAILTTIQKGTLP